MLNRAIENMESVAVGEDLEELKFVVQDDEKGQTELAVPVPDLEHASYEQVRDFAAVTSFWTAMQTGLGRQPDVAEVMVRFVREYLNRYHGE